MIRSEFHNAGIIASRPYCSLYRAVRRANGEPCLLMVPAETFPRERARKLLRHEYSITSTAAVDGMIRARELAERDGSVALLLDDFRGVPLTHHIERFPGDIGAALHAARSIAAALAGIHEKKLVHRTLDNRCVILSNSGDSLNEETRAGLTFFSFACCIGDSQPTPPDLSAYSDCILWEYMAPETTGLVDIPVDHRADLYSLGIVMYQMLTGTVPYRSKNIKELMHWHVSHEPRSVGEINGSVPRVLNDIIMLLLKKEPSERYDNALSLANDLHACLKTIGADGSIRSFRLNRSITSGIIFPDTVYGREKERTEIIETFDSVRGGGCASTFISGNAGVGKTALVRSIRDYISSQGGVFAAGKADQYRREVPYCAFSAALRAVVDRLLLLGDRELSALKKEMVRTIGPNMRFLYDIVPELRYITGPVAPRDETDPASAENRFRAGLFEFLRITAKTCRGFVIFLDDLQWADHATLKELKNLIAEGIPGIYVIGAYRDNEVGEGHPLLNLIAEAGKSEHGLHLIRLDALGLEHVENILAGVLDERPRWITRLAAFVFNKTGGNPFYLREFIIDMFSRGCLRFQDNTWKWDERLGRAVPATENVLVLLAGMMDTLESCERRVLKAASCVGGRFELNMLDAVMEKMPKRTSHILGRLIKGGYLINEGGGVFAFSHDRIQEAAHGLLTREEKAELHGNIGQRLLSRHGVSDEHIFEIADHFNEAGEAAEDHGLLIDLNIRAGLKAKSNFAYGAAVRYFEKSLRIYKKSGSNDRDLKYRLHRYYGECLFLNAEYDRAGRYLNRAMCLTDDILEKADICVILANAKMFEMKYDEAIAIGLKGLELFGIEIDMEPEKLKKQLDEEKRKLDTYLKDINVEYILNMPPAENPDQLRFTKLMVILSGILFHTSNQHAFIYLSLMVTRMNFEHGLITYTYSCFTTCAYLLIGYWNEYKSAYILGEAGYLLNKKYKQQSQSSLVDLQYGGLIHIWKNPLRDSLEIIRTAYINGIKNGDYLYAALAVTHYTANKFCSGREIAASLEELENDILFLEKTKITIYHDNFVVLKMIFSDLAGKEQGTYSDTWDEVSEGAFIKELIERKSYVSIFYYYSSRIMALYLYAKYKEGRSFSAEYEKYKKYIIGWSFTITEFHFYNALNLLACVLDSHNVDKITGMEELSDAREKYRLWSSECPGNFLCRHLLIEAECARLEGDFMFAMTLYDQAIASARENGFTQVEAIACERAALFWLSLHKDDFAAIYLKRAYERFGEWGAMKKLAQLREKYPEILHEHTELESLSGHDILALLEHFNELSRHMESGELLKVLGGIVLRHSGADLFGLVIERDGRMFLQALCAAGPGDSGLMRLLPVDAESHLPVEMIRYIRRTGEKMVVYDGRHENTFNHIPYFRKNSPRSAVCIKADAENFGTVWYLENRSISGVFTGVRKTTLELLAHHAAICIRNALLAGERERAAQGAGFAFRYLNEVHIVPYDNIIYFSSHKRHTVMHTVETTYEIPRLLKDVVSELPADRFIRIHKQYIVNLRHVTRIRRTPSGGYVIFMNDEDDTRLSVGRTYRSVMAENLLKER